MPRTSATSVIVPPFARISVAKVWWNRCECALGTLALRKTAASVLSAMPSAARLLVRPFQKKYPLSRSQPRGSGKACSARSSSRGMGSKTARRSSVCGEQSGRSVFGSSPRCTCQRCEARHDGVTAPSLAPSTAHRGFVRFGRTPPGLHSSLRGHKAPPQQA